MPFSFRLRAAAALLFVVLPGSAAPLTDLYYANNSAWQSRISLIGDETFASLAATPFATYSYTSLTGFTVTAGQNSGTSPFYAGSFSPFGRSLQGPYYSSQLPYFRVSFTSPLTAVGFSLGMYSLGGNLSFITSAGDTATLTNLTANTPTFFGFTSNTAISYVDIYNSAGATMINRVQTGNLVVTGGGSGGGTGNPAETPEIASLLLCASGLCVFGAKRYRLSQAAQV